ncbi:hypothetical protein [Candidatus Coxiella mudrowiae]|uniref:hypothetical protein n=1 Tax=Candidatus Coxiella mudrowiae TaxID=2054173 RepID=UPI000662481F|nr:hypothetical protein [Candidatus Coxiella mudrowiae]
MISQRYLIRYGKLGFSENKLFFQTQNVTNTIFSKIEKHKEYYFKIDRHEDFLEITIKNKMQIKLLEELLEAVNCCRFASQILKVIFSKEDKHYLNERKIN